MATFRFSIAMTLLLSTSACSKTPSSTTTTTPSGPSTPVAPVADPAVRTGPVAPGCTDTPCFEVDAEAQLSCKRGPMNPAQWDSRFGITGVTDRGGCVVYRDGNGADINMQVLNRDASDHSELFIRLRNYTGPGRYKLVDEEDRGGVGRGFFMRANVGVPDKHTTVGATQCTPGCEAIVTARSEAVAAPGQMFRIDLDVVCAGGSLDDGKPCNDHAACGLTARALHVEALCKTN